MDSAWRRQEIVRQLSASEQPVSASLLAGRFGVSRQIIVGDIALLRAAGEEIFATPRGYVLRRQEGNTLRRPLSCTVACRHSREQLGEELYAIVDNGGGVEDVIIEHAVYGQISGQLQLFSRYDVEAFLKKLEDNEASPLSSLTGGIHLHTISYPSEEVRLRILDDLKTRGILYHQGETGEGENGEL